MERITKSPDYSGVIAQEMGLTIYQVRETMRLLDDGNTIPFIARYRKEITGSLDEEVLRQLAVRYKYLKSLEERKEEIAQLLHKQEKMSPDLLQRIEESVLLQELEDIYRPFRPKKRTKAAKAKERGLEPLAQLLWEQEWKGDLEAEAEKYIDEEKDVKSIGDALEGAKDILAEIIADNPKYREKIRPLIWKKGSIVAEGENREGRSKYENYFDFKEPLSKIPPHRVLALNRGEKEEELKVRIALPQEEILHLLKREILLEEAPGAYIIVEAIEDAIRRLLGPSMEREFWRNVWERAQDHGIQIFSQNLRRLLLQPPLGGKKVLAIDPAYRTGCKVVVIGPVGEVEETLTIYPHAPVGRWQEARERLKEMIREKGVSFVAIGNGTASRETEELIAEIIKDLEDLKYIIIDEAGASVYSASPLAKEELPGLGVEMRGAVSIGRRLQDPLAELVKIDPRSIGVGLYQHDLNEKRLEEALGDVVESCVNYVGVDVNTASPYLLSYVAGIHKKTAKTIFAHRLAEGPFTKREDLLNVKGIGPKTFEQAAGFLHLFSFEDPLARTPIHPESYGVALSFLKKLGIGSNGSWSWKDLSCSLQEWLKNGDREEMAEALQVGRPTLDDMIAALQHPGRDPREDLPSPIFHQRVLRLEDLREGMILKGTVRNVVDFGAFVDIGIKEDGLIHISKLRRKYVAHPLEVVGVGDVVEVEVIDIDRDRKRIALSMAH